MALNENHSHLIFYIEPIAASVGWSGKQTKEALEMIIDSGVEAPIAVTSLRMLLVRLSTGESAILTEYGISYEDIDPRTHTLTEILDRLSDMTKDDFYKLAGYRAGEVFWANE